MNKNNIKQMVKFLNKIKEKHSQRAINKRERLKQRYLCNRLKKAYGITLKDYDDMFEQQNGVCEICQLPEINKRLSVDHNHETGKVRGLLCMRCNFAVNFVENHDVKKLKEYIKSYEQ